MKVVLIKDVKDLGRRGEIVNVAEGYARNYLLPRKLATPARAGAIRQVAARKEFLELRQEHQAAEAQEIAERLGGMSVTVTGKTGSATTKLYGSITHQDIADALLKQHHVKVDKRSIHVDEPIKSTGTHEASIKLHHDVSATITVEVVAEG
jgi:large subunit ribosomal protein L9